MLSGGERQRISLARALLKDAPVIVLDEATAFIDPENEEKMNAAISEVIRGKAFLGKAPIVAAYFLIAAFIENRVTGRSCIWAGVALVLCMALQCLFQNLTDRMQSGAGFEMLADLRKKLGAHLRRMPMGFFRRCHEITFSF